MNRSKRQALFGALGLLLMLVLTPLALAQHIRGALEGTVTDQNQALVQGAAVTVKSVSTGVETKAATDAQGRFSLQNLEVGNYIVSVEKTGFRKSITTDVVVKVGSVTPL